MNALKMLNVDCSLGKDFFVIISPLLLIRHVVFCGLFRKVVSWKSLLT